MSDVISKVCLIPRDFKVSGNRSMIQLLQESGYLGCKNGVVKDEVIKFLENHPDLIEDWQIYSLDKRTSTGWYLLYEDSVWTVGYLNDGGREKEHKFVSGFEACAVFIINEIKQLAKNTI